MTALSVPPLVRVVDPALVADQALLCLHDQAAGGGLCLIHLIENTSIREAERAPGHILVCVPGLAQGATPEADPDHTAHARGGDIHLFTEDITGLLHDTDRVAGHVHIVEVAILEVALHHTAEDITALQDVRILLGSRAG